MHRVVVYIIRHGETDSNAQGIIQGQLDTPLNAVGFEQSNLVGQVLKSVPFTHAYTSTLQRAVDTAKAIIAHHPDVTLEESPLIMERNLGKRQGERVGSRAPASRREKDPSMESGEALSARLIEFWQKYIMSLCTISAETATVPNSEIATSEGPEVIANVLVVSHGASIATLIRVLAATLRYNVSRVQVDRRKLYNTSITEVWLDYLARPDKGGRMKISGSIVRYSDARHLLEREIVKDNADVIEETPPSVLPHVNGK